MSWDKTKPIDAQKLRTLAGVIRANWEAIEEGDDVGTSNMLQQRSVQLDDRTGLAANNDPQTNAGTHYLYSKDDGGGTQEAFFKDSAANVIQLTEAGRLGSANTDITCKTLRFGSDTFDADQNSMITAWARVTSAGVLTDSFNIDSVALSATATYTVTISASVMSNANYGIITACNDAANNRRIVANINNPVTITTTEFAVRTRDSSAGPKATDWYFVLTGGR